MFGVFRKPTARSLILRGIADGTFTIEHTTDFRSIHFKVKRDVPGLPVVNFTIWQSSEATAKWWGVGYDYTYHSSESWMDQMDKIKIFHAAQRVYDARVEKAKAAIDVAAHDAMLAKLTGGK